MLLSKGTYIVSASSTIRRVEITCEYKETRNGKEMYESEYPPFWVQKGDLFVHPNTKKVHEIVGLEGRESNVKTEVLSRKSGRTRSLRLTTLLRDYEHQSKDYRAV